MLEINNLDKKFNEFQALSHINMKLEPGKVFGLVGINGSGKTTLIRHVMGLYRPDKGRVAFNGKPVYDNISVKQSLGYISDECFFYAFYTLKQMAQLYKGLYKQWDESRYQSLVKVFNLDEKKSLRKFSKGMKKQAAFCLVMATKPKLLVLDEPIDGLDPLVRRSVFKFIIEDISNRQMSVLISSHNLSEIEHFCDTIGFMKGGVMVSQSTVDNKTNQLHKVQIVFGHLVEEKEIKDILEVVFFEIQGKLHTLVVRGEKDVILEKLEAYKPVMIELLPLSLEEVFAYEMGGDLYV